MSCYQSASAQVIDGTTGPVLVVKVMAYGGIVPATIEKGNPPFNPKNVFPVIIRNSVPMSATLQELKVTHDLSHDDEFDAVEVLCPTRIEVTKDEIAGH